MATEWYRNKTWNTEIENNFEAKLKRSRGTYHKAQYLKIQGIELLDTDSSETQLIGVNLLLRLIREYQVEEMLVINGHEILANHYLEIGDFEKAEFNYRVVVDRYLTKTRNGTSGIADLKLAETILRSNQADKLHEAYQLFSTFSNDQSLQLSFNNQRFYHVELGALLCDKLQKKSEARKYAIQALELSRIKTPDFARHKSLGLVNATINQIKVLQNIAE